MQLPLVFAIVICLTSTLDIAMEEVKQPYGIQLCYDHCRRLVGCTSVIFSWSRLACQVPGGNFSGENPTGDERIYSVAQNDLFLPGNKTCPRQAKIIENRRQNRLCVTDLKNLEYEGKKVAGLLIADLCTTKHNTLHIHRLFFHNDTTANFTLLLPPAVVFAMVYNERAQCIIFASRNPHIL